MSTENNTDLDTTKTPTTEEPAAAPTVSTVQEEASQLRSAMGAVRLSFNWIGTRRKLSDEMTAVAAQSFSAQTEGVLISKKLFDTKNPAYRALTAIKSQAQAYWRSMTLPFPQAGVRLIKREDVPAFEAEMERFRSVLADAVLALSDEYENIKTEAQQQLGTLYNPNDYPTTLDNIFSIFWEYPNVEAPNYLMHYSPELYRQEQARVQQRFEDAVLMAENAFAEELQGLVDHLIERLTDDASGDKKQFRGSAIQNFHDFAEQFNRVNIRSNADLTDLVNRASALVSGVDPKTLRQNNELRHSIKTSMSELKTSLDDLVTTAPSRRLILD